MTSNDEFKFAVYAESTIYDKPLIEIEISFTQLIDKIIHPYENDNNLFIDGVSLSKKNIKKIKLIRLSEQFLIDFHLFNHKMTRGEPGIQKLYAEQYSTRIEAMFREHGDDVTYQVIKAYDSEIKPQAKNYLPNKEKMIEAVLKVFIKLIEIGVEKSIN